MDCAKSCLRRPPVNFSEEVARMKLPSLLLKSWQATRSGRCAEDLANVTHLVGLVRGSINVEALASSVSALIRRHKILCGRIEESESEVCICLDESFVPRMEIVDLRQKGVEAEEDSIEAQAKKIVHKIVWKPFEFDIHSGKSGPLFRVFLVRLSEERSIFGFVAHHILIDGMSITIIGADLDRYYKEAVCGGITSTLTPALGFIDHFVSLDNWLASDAGRLAVRHWKEKIGNPPIFMLPPDPAARVLLQNTYQKVEFKIPRVIVEGFRDWAGKRRIRISTLFMAAYILSISKRSGLRDCVINVTHFGRDQMRLFKSVGFFATHVSMRVAFFGDVSFKEFIEQIERDCEDIFGETPVSFLDDPAIRACPSFNFRDLLMEPHSHGDGLFSELITPEWPQLSVAENENYGNGLILRGKRDGMWGCIFYRGDLYASANIQESIIDMLAMLSLGVEEGTQSLVRLFSSCEFPIHRKKFSQIFGAC